MKRKRLLLGCLLGAGVFLCICIVPVGIVAFLGYQIRREDAYLQRPEVYGPVANLLPLYCQSDPALFPRDLGCAWFPEPLRSKGGGWATVSPTSAHIEMGGGFYHFGYRVDLDQPASTAGANVWHLYFVSENSPDRLLCTVTFPPSARLSADQIADQVAAGYDALIAGPGGRQFRVGKVLHLLRCGRTADALQSCRQWASDRPDQWLPRFTEAHLRCRLGEPDEARADFANWVGSHESFSNYVCLALFNIREGMADDALAAVRRALDQPFVELIDAPANKFYLGQNAALIAFARKDYDLCLAMCDKILKVRGQEPYWKRKVTKLKAAALVLRGDQWLAVVALADLPSPGGAWALEPEQLRADSEFRDAVGNGNAQFLADYARWKDTYDDLFTPYDTDETFIYGRDDLPSPYPPDWRKNLGL